jgi:hypothetical protein
MADGALHTLAGAKYLFLALVFELSSALGAVLSEEWARLRVVDSPTTFGRAV